MINEPIPNDLCPAHHQIAIDWRNNDYDRRNPGEWPAGVSAGPDTFALMDSRTTHEEREAEFDRKNRQQMEMAIRHCRSGVSLQCTPGFHASASQAGTPAP